MALGFEDFEITIERDRGTGAGNLWMWSIRCRIDDVVHRSGRSHGSRTAACGEAALAVFQLLTTGRAQGGEKIPDQSMTTGN